MKFKRFLKVALLGLALISPSFAREVIDQLNRKVTLPEEVDRVVVLQHQTLDILVQLGAADKLVGVMSSWEKHLGESFTRLAPNVKDLPMPGDLTTVNIESLLALNPQVVFVTNYMPEDMIKKIEDADIPVVAVSLRVDDSTEESSKLNPTLKDASKAYDAGLKQGIELIGEVVNKAPEAKEMVDYIFTHTRPMIKERLKNLKESDRVRIYVANPDLVTYGSGKYVGVMLENAGALNVAADSIVGYKQVSMEDVLRWNPEVIFVQHRFPSVVNEIIDGAQWQNIKAVEDNNVYHMPEYAKAWGYPMPESIAIGELWIAATLYPELFKDIDMLEEANNYYQKFYRTTYTEE